MQHDNFKSLGGFAGVVSRDQLALTGRVTRHGRFKNRYRRALLGNIILQVLESHGVKTVNKVQLGTTPVVRGAITSGELDIYPEYTGNGAFFFKDENDPAWKNAQAGYDKVKKLDAEQNKLIWLTPAPANNTWTIAVRQDVAQKNKLESLADLGRYLKDGGTFKLAASAEFIERADALPAFEKTYGFKLNQNQLLSLAGGYRGDD